MPAIHIHFARSSSSTTTTATSTPVLTPTMFNLLIALITLLFVALCMAGALLILRLRRRRRQHQQAQQDSPLPKYTLASPSSNRPTSNHRRLTITTSPSYGRKSSIYVSASEKETFINANNSGASSPTSPIPEIRITFPEEEDAAGKRKSGRVVVVRIGDKGVGLEPVVDEDEVAPPYQVRGRGGEGFQSLDLERIGGLKEKEGLR